MLAHHMAISLTQTPKEPIHRRLYTHVLMEPGCTTEQIAAHHPTIPQHLLSHYLRHLRLCGWLEKTGGQWFVARDENPQNVMCGACDC